MNEKLVRAALQEVSHENGVEHDLGGNCFQFSTHDKLQKSILKLRDPNQPGKDMFIVIF